ncbi:MAG: RecX family transcriptional regulator [bacterium]|nr:RecX family transcriptional regulator [bacterium]
MTITDIKQQVKRQDRYSIYVDGKYKFSLSESELLKQQLRIGQEITDIEQIEQTALEDKAKMRAFDQLSRRPRSMWEMQEYLKRKGYEQELVEKVLNMLSTGGYLDDKKFAQAWVRNRRATKSTSLRRLSQELRAKRVSDSVINEVLEEDEADEKDVLEELIEKKQKQTRYQDREKLLAYLLRQGFNYGDIKELI